VPNPATFSLNGITFGATSVDSLFHVRKEELTRRTGEIASNLPAQEEDVTDLTTHLCRHLFQQRSFYPVFPPPLEHSADVNLDVTHLDRLRLDDEHDGLAPDILVLPSRLKHFSKAVSHSTVINPSYLTKGMYCTIEVASGVDPLRQRLKVDNIKLDL